MKTYDVMEKRAPDPGVNARSAFDALQRVIDAAVPWHRGGLSLVDAAERALTRQPGAYWAEAYAAYSGSTLTVSKLAEALAERIRNGRPAPPIFEPNAQTAKSDLAQTLASLKMLDEAFEEAAREGGFRKAFALHAELADQIRRGRVSGVEAVVRLKRAA
jgi:hypothetical protein